MAFCASLVTDSAILCGCAHRLLVPGVPVYTMIRCGSPKVDCVIIFSASLVFGHQEVLLGSVDSLVDLLLVVLQRGSGAAPSGWSQFGLLGEALP